jgi:hypothetical protein
MASELPQAADLFGDIEATPKVRLRDYGPGLMVAGWRRWQRRALPIAMPRR